MARGANFAMYFGDLRKQHAAFVELEVYLRISFRVYLDVEG